MSSLSKPRLVVVTRKTPLELLLDRHGTMGQARFYLTSRNQSTAWYEEAHERFQSGFAKVQEQIPADQRRVRVDRDQLDRFVFSPDDVVLVVGQDGLVPNVAKYLRGQTTIGVNPDLDRYDGVLCRHPPDVLSTVFAWLENPKGGLFRMERRTMAVAEREDGQRLLALNEVFIGHRTHQSAKYRLDVAGIAERHSSSGIIIATGTGCTGWARSIARQRGLTALPQPEEARLAWFVREPFPSTATGTGLDFGLLTPGMALVATSELGTDGVVFADGIEQDRLEFLDGHTVRVAVADQALCLVVPAS